eukprot:m51a1_g315 hypothetical protein (163) ;mRNA; r:417557-418045
MAAVLCSECGAKQAELACPACDASLCAPCDAAIHSFRTTRHHSRRPLTSTQAPPASTPAENLNACVDSSPACHICSLAGHTARSCPCAAAASQSAAQCTRCGAAGHEVGQCEACGLCWQTGHREADCPLLDACGAPLSGAQGGACAACGGRGHTSRTCPSFM